LKAETGKINIGAVAGLFVVACIAWAVIADLIGLERGIYSFIMRWVNFAVIALVAVKYGKKPIVDFLNNQRDDIATSIEELEEAKRMTEEKVKESQHQLKAGQERLEEIKQRIIDEGERRKVSMIEDAQREGAVMLDSAKLKIESQMRDAQDRIRAELIDLAADMAGDKLPQLLTAKDQERLLSNWMAAAEKN